MKDTVRQPTTLARLQEISERLTAWHADEGIMPDEVEFNDAIEWINWTLNFLETRKLYHKKAAVKQAILQRMAKTLLSESELAAIDAEAEKQL